MDQLIKDRYNDTILQEAMRRCGIEKDQGHSLNAFESFIYAFEHDSRAYILCIAHNSRCRAALTLGEVVGSIIWLKAVFLLPKQFFLNPETLWKRLKISRVELFLLWPL